VGRWEKGFSGVEQIDRRERHSGHPRLERAHDENVQQEKGRQPEQCDHPCQRAVPALPGEGRGDGTDLRR